MHDLFPIPAPPFLQKLARPLSNYLSLTTLPLHIHEAIFALSLYFFIQIIVSPIISAVLFPRSYPKLNARSKLSWDVHVVSFFQSCLICALSLYVMIKDDDRRDMSWVERVHGYTPSLGMVAAFGLGYFTWDLIVTGTHVHIFGFGMLAHAISAITVFSLGFRPFVYYYCPTFLLYELSSPFLNIHWFLDKLDMTGSLPQLINGIILLSTFACCRLGWGTYSSVCVFIDIFRAWKHGQITYTLAASDAGMMPSLEAALRTPRGLASDALLYAAGKDVPAWLAFSYLASNITLNSLNWYWFGKMIATIRKRFDPPFGTKRPEDADVVRSKLSPATVKQSVDSSNGTTALHAHGTEIRHRRKPTLKEEIEQEEVIM